MSRVIEVVSRDPSLVASIEQLCATAGHRVEAVADPTLIARVLATAPTAPRVVDLAAVPLTGHSLALGQRRGDELVLVLPVPERASVRLEVYGRSALTSLLHDLGRLLPQGQAGARLLLGDDAAIEQVRRQIGHLALYPDVSVLVLGETGTGKEIVARAIHEATGSRGELVAINCAALPGELLEAELFGHEAGSFTDARGPRVGLFEVAGEGTVLLDEIGEMPLPLQAKLLRVLETRTFRRLGSNREIPLRARIVSATNRTPGEGNLGLRGDILYRLAGFTIVLPPLRDRGRDVELLAEELLERFASRHRCVPIRLSPGARSRLRAHGWPGNVRELKAVVERLAITTTSPVIEGPDVDRALCTSLDAATVEPDPTLERIPPRRTGEFLRPLPATEREVIESAMRNARGNVSRAAAELGIARSTLRDKLRRLGIVDDDGRPGR